MFSRYKPNKVRDQLRIFIAFTTHVQKDSELKKKGEVTKIYRDYQANKTCDIAARLENYCKNVTAINAVRQLEAGARFLSDNADVAKNGCPNEVYQRYLDILAAAAPKLKQKCLDEALDIIKNAVSVKNSQKLSDDCYSYLYNVPPTTAQKIEALTLLAQEKNISKEFVDRVIREDPSFQMDMSMQYQSPSQNFVYQQPTGFPQQPYPQASYQMQPGMMPPPPGMMPPPMQGGYQMPMGMPPQGFQGSQPGVPSPQMVQPPPQMGSHPGMYQHQYQPQYGQAAPGQYMQQPYYQPDTKQGGPNQYSGY